MHLLWLATVKDLKRIARDPLAALLWMGIPLLIGGIIILAFGNVGKAPPKAHLLVADEDGSFVSGLFVSLLGREELRVLRTEEVDRSRGEARLREGEGSALLIIPEGFGAALLEDEPAELRMFTNPSQSVLPRISEQMVETLLDLVFYAQRILGDEIRGLIEGVDLTEEGPSDEVAGRISVAVNGTVRRAQRYLFPPVLTLDRAEDEGGEVMNFAVLFLPGIVLMGLFFLAGGISEDMWRERMQGTFRQAVSAPRGVRPVFAGKVLAGMVVAGASSLVLLLVGMLYLDLPLRLLPVAVLWCALTGGLLLIGMCWIQMVAPSHRSGQVFTNTVTYPLLMLGGSFFPSEVMPDFLAAIGRYTPNGWALERLKDLLLERASVGAMAAGFGVLALAVIVLFLLVQPRLRAFARST